MLKGQEPVNPLLQGSGQPLEDELEEPPEEEGPPEEEPLEDELEEPLEDELEEPPEEEGPPEEEPLEEPLEEEEAIQTTLWQLPPVGVLQQ